MNADLQAVIWDTVNHLAARWARADKQVLRKVFPFLAEGLPVLPSRIAEATGRDMEAIETALKQGHAGRDQQGRVVELSGLTLSPTMHRIEIGQVALYTCCALFSHVVPMLLGREATVESVDPVSRRVVKLSIASGGVLTATPPGAVATLATTERDVVMRDVGRSFCCHVRHFASAESAAKFVKAIPGRYVVSLGEFHEAASRLYEVVWAAGGAGTARPGLLAEAE